MDNFIFHRKYTKEHSTSQADQLFPILEQQLQENVILASFDVVGLYPNIPHEEVINQLVQKVYVYWLKFFSKKTAFTLVMRPSINYSGTSPLGGLGGPDTPIILQL